MVSLKPPASCLDVDTMNTLSIHTMVLRIIDTIRERTRWRSSSLLEEPRVYYGQKNIPNRKNLLSGGLVKLQDLTTRFPNHTNKPNILYLISSALPPNPDILVKFASRAGIPIVLNQNGVAYPAWHGPGWEATNRRLASVYNQATYVIFQSEFCKTSARKFLGPGKGQGTILPNPVNTAQFSPPDQDRRPGKEAVMLVAGSHNFSYKIKTAIDTLAYLADREHKCVLSIAGRCCWKNEEDCHREILKYSTQKGVKDQIRITGPYVQEQAVKLFRQADILLHPTYNDSCPRLVVEAMACGTPVVYSATGGTPELVHENAGIGVAGPSDWNEIHPPAPAELGKAIIRVLDNYASFSRGAREHCVQNLGLNNWLKNHALIFQELLSTGTISHNG